MNPLSGVFAIGLSAALLFIPAMASAALVNNSPAENVIQPNITITGEPLENITLLQRYAATPTPLEFSISVKDTLPGVKGEMAAGPRKIGIALSPDALISLAAVACMIGVSGWYFIRCWRRRTRKAGDDKD